MISQNGWTASKTLPTRKFVVNGVEFVGGIRDDDNVEFILRYFAEQYAARVEPLKNPGCWGYYFKLNANDHSVLSNHSSGTAIDFDAPEHPNGVPTTHTFSAEQIAEVHKILHECHGALRWGGDYHVTPDAMHVEVNVSDTALAGIVRLMRESHGHRPAHVREALKAINEQQKDAGPAQQAKLQKAEDALREIKKR